MDRKFVEVSKVYRSKLSSFLIKYYQLLSSSDGRGRLYRLKIDRCAKKLSVICFDFEYYYYNVMF